MTFDPNTAQPLEVQQSSSQQSSFDPNTASVIEDHPIINRINAVGGGVVNGLANIPEGVNNSITWILKHVGIVSQDTADKLYAANKESIANTLRPSENSISGQAMEQHPGYAMGGEFGANLAGAVTAGSLVPEAVGAAASSLAPEAVSTGAGVIGRAIGMGAANTGMVNPQDQNTAFLTGIGISGASDATNWMLNQLGSKATNIQKVKDIISNYSKDKVDQAYDQVRSLKWSPIDNIKTSTLADTLKSTIEANIDNLTEAQAKALGNIHIDVSNSNSFDSLLNTYQNLGNTIKSKFSGSQANKPLYQALQGIKSAMEDHINSTAASQGINETVQNLNNMYTTRLATKKLFSGINEIPNDLPYKSITRQLLQKADNYSAYKGLQPAAETLRGLAKITKTIQETYQVGGWQGRIAGGLVGGFLGGGAGVSIGKEEGGHEIAGSAAGGALGASAGVLLGPYIINKLSNYANTPEGQTFLRSLSKPGIIQQDIRNVVKGLGIMGMNELQNSTNTNGQ